MIVLKKNGLVSRLADKLGVERPSDGCGLVTFWVLVLAIYLVSIVAASVFSSAILAIVVLFMHGGIYVPYLGISLASTLIGTFIFSFAVGFFYLVEQDNPIKQVAKGIKNKYCPLVNYE